MCASVCVGEREHICVRVCVSVLVVLRWGQALSAVTRIQRKALSSVSGLRALWFSNARQNEQLQHQQQQRQQKKKKQQQF